MSAAEEFLKRDRPPTVPDTLAVAGIDDIDIAAHHAIQLTTVSHHASEMASVAATWMLEIVQDPARFVREPVRHVLRPTLTIRRTCGAVR